MNAVVKGIAALALSATLVGSAAAETKELNFGIISTESTQNLKSTWVPFLEAMEDAVGMKVNPFFASDYAGVIEGMRFDKVDVAWFGNKSAMEAVDRSGGEVFAQTVDGDGNPGYWSLILVNKDAPFNKLEDILKCDGSLNFGIGDPNSTSGFLVPTTFIFAKNGIDPKKCFKTVRNANHETNALAVANKQVDAATNNTENLRRLETTNPEARANIKVIWQSPLIPSDPLVWRKDLDEPVKDKVYKFIMSYGRIGTPEEVAKARKVLAGLEWAPFKPSSDAQLYPIRVLAVSKDMAKIENDDKLSADEKKAKLTELAAEKKKWEDLMAEVPQM
ncbi:phosphonate ABC transporter substrate-binding protein [Rhodobium gokarnense]|uniref:Phosphonate transport system substrate-binding protein n=1 Tax=Rhodobium gokarnense TaxID=364296 RepID=A0ABT3HDS2_9HYPH|nr:phosphonate ABC transporter substrate-binding protein [Rhodobium gokarnense]MCW2308545.1 phosphonate transport system substrate-binding protein [Rhodobium gokarnense]